MLDGGLEKKDMGEPSVFDKIRQTIGSIAYSVFLWAINMTSEEYFENIKETSDEVYPTGWVKLVLRISPEGYYHAVGGDREPGEGDRPYIGLERLKKAKAI